MRLTARTAVAGLLIATHAAVSCAETPGPNGASGERTRVFAAQKCQFMLPADDWSWVDRPIPHGLFAAESADGWVVLASCAECPSRQRMDQSAAEGFKRSLTQASEGQLKVRSEGFVSFLGLSCYQLAGAYSDGRTTVSRFFLANGFAYHVMVIGGSDPVEQQPGFEKVQGGFAFTQAPVPAGGSGFEPNLETIIGGLAFFFMVALASRFVRSPGRYSSRLPQTHFVDAADGEQVKQVAGTEGGGTVSPRRASRTGPREGAGRPSRPGLGQCRLCGYGPLAYGAPYCPSCAGREPNPGVISRCAGRGAIAGIVLGAGGGAIWGLLVVQGGGAVGLIVGLLLGTLGGILVGVAGGLIWGVLARVAGNP